MADYQGGIKNFLPDDIDLTDDLIFRDRSSWLLTDNDRERDIPWEPVKNKWNYYNTVDDFMITDEVITPFDDSLSTWTVNSTISTAIARMSEDSITVRNDDMSYTISYTSDNIISTNSNNTTFKYSIKNKHNGNISLYAYPSYLDIDDSKIPFSKYREIENELSILDLYPDDNVKCISKEEFSMYKLTEFYEKLKLGPRHYMSIVVGDLLSKATIDESIPYSSLFADMVGDTNRIDEELMIRMSNGITILSDSDFAINNSTSWNRIGQTLQSWVTR